MKCLLKQSPSCLIPNEMSLFSPFFLFQVQRYFPSSVIFWEAEMILLLPRVMDISGRHSEVYHSEIHYKPSLRWGLAIAPILLLALKIYVAYHYFQGTLLIEKQNARYFSPGLPNIASPLSLFPPSIIWKEKISYLSFFHIFQTNKQMLHA